MTLQVEKGAIRTDQECLTDLIDWFKQYRSCVVAFSAGVDSSLLAYCARQALSEKAYAVTSLSPSFSEIERKTTREIASELGIQLLEVVQDDLGNPEYVANGVNRCYVCRSNLARTIQPIRDRLSVEVCVDGTHLDDMKSPRPGIRALRKAGFRAPFVELQMGKDIVRSVARYVGLSNSERPSETCLSSRVAFGQKIDLVTLQRIENAESIVKSITKASIVRVRTIGTEASVEVDKSTVPIALERLDEIRQGLEELGYEKVTIDPQGYTSGKMLELFVKNEH